MPVQVKALIQILIEKITLELIKNRILEIISTKLNNSKLYIINKEILFGAIKLKIDLKKINKYDSILNVYYKIKFFLNK
jgi:ASC-1-like (ASCH) protein